MTIIAMPRSEDVKELSMGLAIDPATRDVLSCDYGSPCSISGRRRYRVLRWLPSGAAGLGRLGLFQDSLGSGHDSLLNVPLDVLPSQAETGTNWRIRVLGIGRMGQIRSHDDPFEAIEVGYAALCRGTEVDGFSQPATLFAGQA